MSIEAKQKARKGTPRVPERTCAACRAQDAPSELIRWVRAEDGTVVPDLADKSFGRGAWIHPRPECLKKLQSALARSFRAPVKTSTAEALDLLHLGALHRVTQLLGAARRQNAVVFGTDATAEAWYRERAQLVLVAQDARAAANAGFVRDAVAANAARVWGTKDELGRLFGRPEIGVLGIVDRGLASRLFGAIAMALLVRQPGFGGAQNLKNSQSSANEQSLENAAQSGQEIEVSSEVE